MEIVKRLRQFMDSRNIPVTQFADTCGIPRPTLSQLLNGRNKKVSDELITKIHDAYPALNVMWLMFGEGSMESGANTQTSEAQIAPQFDFDAHDSADSQTSATDDIFKIDIRDRKPEKSDPAAESLSIDFTEEKRGKNAIPPAAAQAAAGSPTVQISGAPKRVASIIVVYSDSTVETFVSANKQ